MDDILDISGRKGVRRDEWIRNRMVSVSAHRESGG